MLSVLTAIAIVFALAAGSGGVAYAADGAVPGDPLYGIDQAVESVQLSLTRDPQASLELLLALAEERLLEAEELPGRGNEGRRQIALERYGGTISSLAQTMITVDDVDAATLTALLDEAFSAHEDRLAGIYRSVDEDEPDPCRTGTSHPVGSGLAESYGVSHEDVMTWFCSGYGFGEIMHALQTSQETGIPPADLLNMKTELGGWGQVWQREGLIRGPKHRPAGPPDDGRRGPPDDRPVGPPEDKRRGPPDDRPVGPPENRPIGPPDNRPVGPPEGRPIGPPEDRPVGPPESKRRGPPGDRPVGP